MPGRQDLPVRRSLGMVVGTFALVAPALHIASDLMEWRQGGFSNLQLAINLVAFLGMPWLLLGIYAVRRKRPSAVALGGALLWAVAFLYFAWTAYYALAEGVADYELLWQRLGPTYTFHGALMVVGGALFAASALRARWLSPWAAWIFLAGIAVNLVVALLPVADLWQVVGSVIRNGGLMAIGCLILADRSATARHGRSVAAPPHRR